MALHPEFPTSPYDELHPDARWCPASLVDLEDPGVLRNLSEPDIGGRLDDAFGRNHLAVGLNLDCVRADAADAQGLAAAPRNQADA